MSRIEEALEKAALIRKEGSVEVVAGSIPAYATPLISPGGNAPDTEKYREVTVPAVDISNPYLVSANNSASQVAEEYRKLKSVVVSMTRREHFLNTLMVTSTFGSEGKSITSLNLAVSLAQEYDHTVLLIDGDLRKPSLHEYLGLKPEKGLAECLMEDLDVGDALIKTGIGKLSFLPAGRCLDNPAEMLSSQKMRNLFAEMKNRYKDRYIIVDTPPVLAVSETRSLASLVDGIVFVVREGVPSPENVLDACNSVGMNKLISVVYNDSASEMNSYGYRNKYGGYYGYGRSEPKEDVGKDKGFLTGILKRKKSKSSHTH